MIAEAIREVIKSHRPPREPILKREDETYLYDDEKHVYNKLERIVKQTASVSNIESFTALVIEWLRRQSLSGPNGEPTGNPPISPFVGDFATVVFSRTGATFSLDDRIQYDVFTYKRTLSDQWVALTGGLALRPHGDFLRLLQLLRPSIGENFPKIFREFAKLQMDSKTRVTSSPILTEGRAGIELSVEVQLASGASQKSSIPGELSLTMPFAQGSATTYTFSVEVDANLEEEQKKFLLGLVFADQKNIEEKAIADEVASFRKACAEKGLTSLLILEDY